MGFVEPPLHNPRNKTPKDPMRKTFALRPEGKHPDRAVEAVKHEIRKYMDRERRRPLPEGHDFWDFDCRFGADKDSAEVVHPASIRRLMDALVLAGGEHCYLELLVKPAVRRKRPVDASAVAEVGAAQPEAVAPATSGNGASDGSEAASNDQSPPSA